MGIHRSVTGEATKSASCAGAGRTGGRERAGGAARREPRRGTPWPEGFQRYKISGVKALRDRPPGSKARVKALRDRPPGSKARVKALRDSLPGRAHGKPGAPEGAPGDMAQRAGGRIRTKGRAARAGRREKRREPKHGRRREDRGGQDADRGVSGEVCGGQRARGQVCVQVPVSYGQPGQPERGRQAGPGRAAADHAARSRRMRQRGHPGGGRAQLGRPGHRRGPGLGAKAGGAKTTEREGEKRWKRWRKPGAGRRGEATRS